MSVQRFDLYRATPTVVGHVNTIHLINQSVTGPAGADGAGVSVATKEGGTTKVAVTTVLDFDGTNFDVTGSSGTASIVIAAGQYDPSGTASSAISSHLAAGDPHAQYALESALGTAAAAAVGDFATAAQGATADAALPRAAAGAVVEDIGAVEWRVNTVAASGATETLDTSVYGVHDVTMDQSCTFTFSNPAPSGKETEFKLILRGAFTPTFPAAVDWASGSAPTYTTPAVYVFSTIDGGTTWFGFQAGKAFA